MARHIYSGVARDGHGHIIPSATIAVFLAGTSTVASVYTALTGGAAVNSVTSATDGSFSFYVDHTDYAPTQLFKISISKSGYTSKEYDYIVILPRSDGIIYVEDYGATGDGTTDDGAAISLAIAAVPTGGVLEFQTKTYAYATSPNFGVSYLKIRGNGATLKHTGTGNAMTISGAGVNKFGLHISDLTVEGGATSDYGIYVRNIHHSKFDHLRVSGAATTADGLRIEYCVLNEWNSFRCTTNESCGATMPANGIVITKDVTATWSTTQTFIHPILEGLSGIGISILYGQGNTFVGGTSESNGYGVVIGNVGGWVGMNTFTSLWCESNVTADIVVEAQTRHNVFVNTVTTNAVDIYGYDTNFVGGVNHGQVTIQAGALYTSFSGFTFHDNSPIDNVPETTVYLNCVGSYYKNIVPISLPQSNDGNYKSLFAEDAAPTTGTWKKGDVVFNSDPEIGEEIGWMCTVAGTPGTWVSMSYLPVNAASDTYFNDITAYPNVLDKFRGKMLWDLTLTAPIWAAGSAAGDVWVDATGATVYTPV